MTGENYPSFSFSPSRLVTRWGLRGYEVGGRAKRAGRMRCGPYDSDSPRPHIGFGTGVQLRPQAPWIWRHGMAPQTQAKTTTGFLALLGLTAGRVTATRAMVIFLFPAYLSKNGGS